MASRPILRRPWEDVLSNAQSPTACRVENSPSVPLEADTRSSISTCIGQEHPRLAQTVDFAQPVPVKSSPRSRKSSEPLLRLAPPAADWSENKRRRIANTEGYRSAVKGPSIENCIPLVNQHYQLPSPTLLSDRNEQLQTVSPSNIIEDCCASRTDCRHCSKARILARAIVSDLLELDAGIQSARLGTEQAQSDSVGIADGRLQETLEWVLETIRWNAARVRGLSRSASRPASAASNPEQSQHDSEAIPGAAGLTTTLPMPNERVVEEEESSFGAPIGRNRGHYLPNMPADRSQRRHIPNPVEPFYSPSRTTASGSAYSALSSPRQAQPHGISLPSPSSMSFPNGPQLPPIISPSGSTQTSAHSTHLQDLQHQVSIKTLALTTLQREYDSLLQKLERQRVKCQTLEKKFEVSDAEINALTDERERLVVHIGTLEEQVDDLVRARDEARKEVVENSAQYMQIVDMANKLQAHEALQSKKLEQERDALQARILALERGENIAERVASGSTSIATLTNLADGSGVTETPGSVRAVAAPPLLASPAALQAAATNTSATNPDNRTATTTISHVTPSPHQSTTFTPSTSSKSSEIDHLRQRIRLLETELMAMAEESRNMRAAALSLAQSGQRMLGLAQGALALKTTSEGDNPAI